MDYGELKLLMRGRARLAKGYVNLLRDDVEYIYSDINKSDMSRLEEDLKDLKHTVQQLMDTATELEYYLYLAKTEHA